MQRNSTNNLTAVTIGDIKGVGLQILIQSWEKKLIKNFILITNFKLFKAYLKANNINLKIYKTSILKKKLTYNKEAFNIFDIEAYNNDHNTLNSLLESYKLVKRKLFRGLVTLPINKKKLSNINSNFIDQTTFFTKKDGKKFSNMIFIHKNIFFVPVTIHLEIKKVSTEFKKTEKVIEKISNINQTMIRDFGLKKPKFIMAGINPHNGENGLISNEDNILLIPIINKLKKMKIDIVGPVSPDAVVNKKNLNNFNCFIFTYHDQALIPFKIISNYSGVNYTSNLDIIRVSPDHGTAYDIVGQNNVSPYGVINSFKLLKKISLNRNKYDRTQKISRSKFSN